MVASQRDDKINTSTAYYFECEYRSPNSSQPSGVSDIIASPIGVCGETEGYDEGKEMGERKVGKYSSDLITKRG